MAIERDPELERFAEDVYQAYREGDIDRIDHALSRDDAVMVVGTDPWEVWRGHEQVMEGLRADMELMEQGAHEAIHGPCRAYREGDVGWVTTRASSSSPTGRRFRRAVSRSFIARTASGRSFIPSSRSRSRTGPWRAARPSSRR